MKIKCLSLLTLLALVLTLSSISAASPLTSYEQDSTNSSSMPTVSVYPNDFMIQKEKGQTFTVNITITNATDLCVWQSGLTFNATILEAVSFLEGPFLKEGGYTLWVDGAIDNTVGAVHYHACALAGNVSGVKGNGTLGTITFKVKSYGKSALKLTNAILLDAVLMDTNKTITDGAVLATIPGDVNGDRIVDVFDILKIKYHRSGPPPGPGGYDPNIDINSDGVIDVFDILIAKAHLGQSW